MEVALINSVIDANINDSPPAEPMINTAGKVRGLLKLITSWVLESYKEILNYSQAINGAFPGMAIEDIVIEGSVTYNIDLSGTYTNFLDEEGDSITVTSEELKSNLVLFRGIDGVFKKVLIELSLSNLFENKNPEEFVINDLNGFKGLSLDKHGNLTINKLLTKLLTINDTPFVVDQGSDEIAFSMGDDLSSAYVFVLYKNGKLLLKTLEAAVVKAKALEVTDTLTFPSTFNIGSISQMMEFVYGFVSYYLLVLSYGQSNSVGGGGGSLTITEKFDALTTNDGPRAGVGPSLIPYANDGVTLPLLGAFNQFTHLIERENFLKSADKTFRFIGTAPGLGSTFAEGLNQSVYRPG